jgi:hypothetical protein
VKIFEKILCCASSKQKSGLSNAEAAYMAGFLKFWLVFGIGLSQYGLLSGRSRKQLEYFRISVKFQDPVKSFSGEFFGCCISK